MSVKNSFNITAKPAVLRRMVQCAQKYKDTKNETYRAQFEGALTILIAENMEGVRQLAIQNASVSSDFQSFGGDPLQITTEEDYFDRGYEMVFRMRDVVPNTLYFILYTVQTSIDWKKMNEGERLDQQGFQGAGEKVFAEYHGAAIGWTDKLMRTSTAADLLDGIRALIVGYWVEKADIYYSLIFAAATATGFTALQGVAGDSYVQRVVNTINEVSNDLGENNKDKGFGDTASLPRVMYCHPRNQKDIEAAFRVTTNAAISGAQSGQQVEGPLIRRHYSYNQYILENQFIMCLPGLKAQMTDVLNPMVMSENKDIYTLNEGKAAWAIHGGAIGDAEQFQGGLLA